MVLAGVSFLKSCASKTCWEVRKPGAVRRDVKSQNPVHTQRSSSEVPHGVGLPGVLEMLRNVFRQAGYTNATMGHPPWSTVSSRSVGDEIPVSVPPILLSRVRMKPPEDIDWKSVTWAPRSTSLM